MDLIEESEGNIHGYELKYGEKLAKIPVSWNSAYPNASAATINQSNWQEFIL